MQKVNNLRRMEDNIEWFPSATSIQKASISDLKLIFSEAQNRLNETIKSKDMYYQRSISLLTISIALLSTIIGYLGAKLNGFQFSLININLIAIAVILVYVCIKAKENLLPVNFDVSGTFPKNLFKERFIYSEEKEVNEKELFVALIQDYQCRIMDNIEKNKNAADNYKDCINWLFYIPLAILVLSVLSTIFSLPV